MNFLMAMIQLSEHVLRSSLEDIVKYAHIEKKPLKKKIAPGKLELLALPKKEKEEKSIEKLVKDVPETVRQEIENAQKAVVRYEFFLPVDVTYQNVSVTYSSSEKRQSMQLTIDDHSVSVEIKKSSVERYSVSFAYNALRKGYDVRYETTEYKERIEIARQDFALKIDKFLEIFPVSLMGGVYGFTYLGSGKIARREDLSSKPDFAHLVDVHESIHTFDEYETRILTDWVLNIERPRYKK